MKKIIAALTLICLVSLAKAQDFPFGSYTPTEINMAKYMKDTAAHAVVLSEFGKTYITRDDSGIPLIFEYHVKIKILDAKAFEKANIEIPVYRGDSQSSESIEEIQGQTYYRDDQGKAQIATLDKKKIFTVSENKYWDNIKFTLPNVRSGSIIEYSYKLKSPYKQNYKPWVFQSDIPKIYSEYETSIPAIYSYNISLIGPLKLTVNKQERQMDCFSVDLIKCDCTKSTYAIADIPAFVEEDYMTASKNFMSAITFELSEYVNLSNGNRKKMSLEWKDVDASLKSSEDFGRQLKRKDLLKETVAPVIAGITDPLEKAKAVYRYLQSNMKWNGITSIYSDGNIRKALEKHTGMVSEINHALIISLNSAGIDAEAVLLSTRDHGSINKLYPVITEFNYVVAKANIGDKYYLLDATDPLLPFGMLPMRCLNDQGRVMSLDKPSYWIDLNKDQKQSTTYMFDLTLQENGKLKGRLINFSKGYSAFEKRKAIKKFNSVDEYIENMDDKLTKLKILKSDIQNIDSLDKTLTETYEVEIDMFDSANHDMLSFNPFVFDRVTTNPFKLDERSYPVDWGMPSENRYVLNVHLPKGYMVENPPQPIAFAMPANGARFLTAYEQREEGFVFSHSTSFNKAIYGSDEYPYLKELYNKIILSEKAEMVFKKKI